MKRVTTIVVCTIAALAMVATPASANEREPISFLFDRTACMTRPDSTETILRFFDVFWGGEAAEGSSLARLQFRSDQVDIVFEQINAIRFGGRSILPFVVTPPNSSEEQLIVFRARVHGRLAPDAMWEPDCLFDGLLEVDAHARHGAQQLNMQFRISNGLVEFVSGTFMTSNM